MAGSSSGDGNDGKAKNSDNLTAICGYKDVNQFSQVTNVLFRVIMTRVMWIPE